MANTYGEVRLVTYDSEIVTPQDDAILYQSVTANGVFNNFALTVGGEVAGVINVPKSFAILAGRFIEIPKQTLQIDLAVGTQVLAGQVYLKIDLSNTQAPCELVAETASNSSDLTEMTQEQDINYTETGLYMLKLGTFAVDNQTVYNPDDPTSGNLPLERNIFLPINAAEETNKNTDKIRNLQSTVNGLNSATIELTAITREHTIKIALLEGTTSVIGSVLTLSNVTKSLANKTYVNFGSITLPPGRWLVIGSIYYPEAAANDSTGWIYVGSNTTGGSNPQTNGSTLIDKYSGHVAEKSVVYTPSSNTKYNLIGWQNSGATLSGCIGYMYAVRIKQEPIMSKKDIEVIILNEDAEKELSNGKGGKNDKK